MKKGHDVRGVGSYKLQEKKQKKACCDEDAKSDCAEEVEE